MAQKKRHAPWLWTKTTETEKGWPKDEDRQEVYVLTNTDPPSAKGNFLWKQQPPCETSHCGMLQPAHGSHWQFWLYGQKLFDKSKYLQVDHGIVFPCSGSNSTQQLDTVIFMWGYIYPLRFQALSGEEFDWGSWKQPRSPHPRLVGRPSAAATNVVDSRGAITSTGQRNHPPNSAVACVLLVAGEKAQCINVPDVMRACVWCLVSQNITPE